MNCIEYIQLVQSKYKSLFRYILTTICYDMGYDYVDFTMKYDTQLKPTYNKLVRTHEEFMFNHKIINIHQMERSEMQTCLKDLQTITTVMSVDETVITEKNGTWVLVMKNPLVQKDLEKIDSIISNNPVMTNRNFNHLPFRKRQPSESMNTDAISSQKDRLKDFTATPLGSNDTWSSNPIIQYCKILEIRYLFYHSEFTFPLVQYNFTCDLKFSTEIVTISVQLVEETIGLVYIVATG